MSAVFPLSSFSYEVRFAAPPWPGLRPTVGAYAYVPAVGPDEAARSLGTQRLAAVGRTGVRISLAARGTILRHGDVDPMVRHGGTVLIIGTTDPRVAHALLRVGAERYVGNDERLRRTEIGAAKTGNDGSFRIPWRPSQSGTYMITADLAHPGDRHFADRACELSLVAR
jgi:hypothetical protein